MLMVGLVFFWLRLCLCDSSIRRPRPVYASLSVYNSKDGSAIGHMMYPRKAPSGAATTGSTL